MAIARFYEPRADEFGEAVGAAGVAHEDDPVDEALVGPVLPVLLEGLLAFVGVVGEDGGGEFERGIVAAEALGGFGDEGGDLLGAEGSPLVPEVADSLVLGGGGELGGVYACEVFELGAGGGAVAEEAAGVGVLEGVTDVV